MVPSTTMLYDLASTVVPGETVSVAPLATVTFPVRTTSPDHVVFTETVLSTAVAMGRTETSRSRETKP